MYERGDKRNLLLLYSNTYEVMDTYLIITATNTITIKIEIITMIIEGGNRVKRDTQLIFS